ncbi:MAG: hypothetical protein HKN14_12670 [Marinicaulis sp.]|nr:hypothetical protein [Marinicaulis sp.]NNE41758.1 hypothetical protein [Marinicaulis sp.]NNL89977.1 hypothetical protein [Marinicaulis sp.]
MTNKKSDWTPEYDEETLKALIRDTIRAVGPDDPSLSPSKIRERIKGRLRGDLDLDAVIAEVQREMKSEG